MSWKQTVYDYVHYKNQAELDYDTSAVETVVDDEAYIAAWQIRLSKTAETDWLRKLMPVKQETRLQLLQAEPHLNGISVLIKLHRSSQTQSRGHLLDEQRIELQRLILHSDAGFWRIVKIDDSAGEREARLLPPLAPAEAEEDFSQTVSMASVPLLNNGLLSKYTPSFRPVSYNRQLAVAYADTYWDRSNPKFLTFEVDCTNYASQCLFAGGAPMHYTGKRASGWWYRGRVGGQEQWSYSWSVANSLQLMLTASHSGLQADEVQSPEQLLPGDVIAYDWDGAGRFEHTTVVTRIDPAGMPLVNAHTVSSRHRYWAYHDSPAWTEKTRYRFLHIADVM
jgi:hypothetical protein